MKNQELLCYHGEQSLRLEWRTKLVITGRAWCSGYGEAAGSERSGEKGRS